MSIYFRHEATAQQPITTTNPREIFISQAR